MKKKMGALGAKSDVTVGHISSTSRLPFTFCCVGISFEIAVAFVGGRQPTIKVAFSERS